MSEIVVRVVESFPEPAISALQREVFADFEGSEELARVLASEAATRADELNAPHPSMFRVAAAVALGFRFEPWFDVSLSQGPLVQSLGLVRQFGSPLGTLLFAESHVPRSAELAEVRALGYFYSVLFESYHAFTRQHFEATLNDWGYYGEEQERPAWYRGKAWSRPVEHRGA